MKCPRCGSGDTCCTLNSPEYSHQRCKTCHHMWLVESLCHGTGEVPDAPRFRPGDRVMVEVEGVIAAGSNDDVIVVDVEEQSVFARPAIVHPLNSEPGED